LGSQYWGHTPSTGVLAQSVGVTQSVGVMTVGVKRVLGSGLPFTGEKQDLTPKSFLEKSKT
jgi:hypothetical protein